MSNGINGDNYFTGGNPEDMSPRKYREYQEYKKSLAPKQVGTAHDFLNREIEAGGIKTILSQLSKNFMSTYAPGPEQINMKGLLESLTMMLGDYVVPGGKEIPEQFLLDRQNMELDEWGRTYQSPKLPQSAPQPSLMDYLNKRP